MVAHGVVELFGAGGGSVVGGCVCVGVEGFVESEGEGVGGGCGVVVCSV